MPSVWEAPGFRRYWVSRIVSSVGTSITLVAVPVLVYTMSRSAWLTSVATVSVTAANVVFGLIGGAIGDRYDRRRVMVVADLVAAVAIGTVVLAHVLGALHVAHVLLAAFLTASAATIFDGANWGALPTLVGRERLPQANSLVWGAVSVLDVAAPALVGLALAVVQPATLLAVDAISYLLVLPTVAGQLDEVVEVSEHPAESVGARWALVAAAVLHLGGAVLARQRSLSHAPPVAPTV